MSAIRVSSPRLVVAGLSGDGGKTLVSIGLGRALSESGLIVRAVKKGPDYIDAAWLAAATGGDCVNLDTFLMSDEAIGSAAWSLRGADLVLIEGNRGLYDGADSTGTHSTAELAKRLGAPVLLVVNVTKATRTVAASVLGCRMLDPEVQIAGVVLNRVGTSRQEALIRRAVEDATGIPVVGAVPRLGGDDPLPGRHLGLLTVAEHPRCEAAIARAAAAVAEHVDLDRVVSLARRADRIEMPLLRHELDHVDCRIGYFADAAFSFYYPENLQGLRARGVDLVAIEPQQNEALPEVDGLYIGGGFPEEHAERLADNRALIHELRSAVAEGLPVYAECGGLMYLARELRSGGSTYPMAGLIDLEVEQTSRPQGHGYEVVTVDRENPFFGVGSELRGHEFHYSRVVAGDDRERTVFSVDRGTGVGGARDGLVVGNVFASYLHLHGLATPQWADGFLALATRFATKRSGPAVAWA